jgi:hypothetical protein
MARMKWRELLPIPQKNGCDACGAGTVVAGSKTLRRDANDCEFVTQIALPLFLFFVIITPLDATVARQ